MYRHGSLLHADGRIWFENDHWQGIVSTDLEQDVDDCNISLQAMQYYRFSSNLVDGNFLMTLGYWNISVAVQLLPRCSIIEFKFKTFALLSDRSDILKLLYDILSRTLLIIAWHLHSADVNETDVRPLSDEESAWLRKKLPFLLDFLSPDDCINHLFARECINRWQAEHLRKQTTSCEQVDQLIDILSRRSYADIKQFVGILFEIGQEHVTSKLVEGGGQLPFLRVSWFNCIITIAVAVALVK